MSKCLSAVILMLMIMLLMMVVVAGGKEAKKGTRDWTHVQSRKMRRSC